MSLDSCLISFFLWIKLAGRSSLKGISRQIKLTSVIRSQAPTHTKLLSGLSFGCYKSPPSQSCSIYSEGSETQFHAAGSVKFFLLLWYFCLHSHYSYGTDCIPDPSSVSMWPLFLCPVAGATLLWWWRATTPLLQVPQGPRHQLSVQQQLQPAEVTKFGIYRSSFKVSMISAENYY